MISRCAGDIDEDKVTLAAANNAAWCDTMVQAHACHTSFQPHT
jgi:hypothetical protein